jgi:hypothetical protein
MNFENITLFIAHAHGGGINIENMIASSLVHGLIYGVIFKIFHNVSLQVAGGIALVGVGALWYFFKKR